MCNNGECITIDWTMMISTIPHYGLDDLPPSVRDFYLVGRVIATAPVCPRHKLNLLTGYLHTVDDASYWRILEVCDPNFSKSPVNIPSEAVANCLLWIEVLAAQWPLAASIFTVASMHLSFENDIWMEEFFSCPECVRMPAPVKDEAWGLLGFRGSDLTEDGFVMVDGFQGESSENDLLTVLEEVDSF